MTFLVNGVDISSTITTNTASALEHESETFSFHIPGAKDDATKPSVGLVLESFPRAFLEVAKIADFGAKKYTRHGWRSVPDGIDRYLNAALRHIVAHYKGELIDPESNCLHLAHAAWGLLAVTELVSQNRENRDKRAIST